MKNTTVHVAPAGQREFSIAISSFPTSLHPVLKEIDDEGNGLLEMDELTEVFKTYADMKKASKDGSIALSSLPKELRPTLKVFDVDGDGTVGVMELGRAAELYKDSKNTVKRMTKVLAVMAFILIALVGCIVGLTAHVVEAAKDSKPSQSGIMQTTGADPVPVATASVMKGGSSLKSLLSATLNDIAEMKSMRLPTDDGAVLIYTITGSRIQSLSGLDPRITFYAARGDSIEVTNNGVKITSAANVVILSKTHEELGKAARRHLLWMGGFDFSIFGMGTSSFSLMM